MAKKTNGAAKKKIARQDDLPGMEDLRIKEIEEAALSYIEGRDARMEATTEEVALKETLIAMMHKHEKTEYRRGRISVRLVVEKETVKVKLQTEDEQKAAKQAEKEAAKEVEVEVTQ